MTNVVEIEQKLTPLRVIRKQFIDCVGNSSEVKDCQSDKLFDGPCLFYRYGMVRGRPSVRLIRKHPDLGIAWYRTVLSQLTADHPTLQEFSA